MSLNNIDYKFLYKAEQVALVSDFSKTHVGAVAVYHGNIIGIGTNTNKTHPRQDYYNKYRNIRNTIGYVAKMHAEISCLNSIRNLDIDFSKVKLYIFRKKLDCTNGMARPCAACMKAIKDIGIKNIYYSTDDGFAYEKLIVG